MYFPRISKYFKQNPKSLTYLNLILHMVKSSQFISFTVFDMSEINKQFVCIEFCFKRDKNATKTYSMIKTTFKDDSLNRSISFECFKRFNDSRQLTKDDPRFSSRPKKLVK